MGLILSVCDHIYVLDFGSIIASGTPAEVREDSAVKAAYLGEHAGAAQAEGRRLPGRTRRRCGRTVTRLLDVRDLSTGYGGTPVVRNVTMHVNAGEVVALLGPNGAGKTTTLLTISGLLAPIDGALDVLGQPAGHGPPHRIARRGLAHVLEDRSLFFGLTVRENLRLGPPRQRLGAYRGI